MAMIGAGENVPFAIGKSFGNILNELDDESLEKLREGQAEYQKRYETIRSNFRSYEERLMAYVEKNQLQAEAAERINNVILDIAEALNEGDIPEEVIDNVWKGIDYDEAKQAEIEAAKLAAKNDAIEDQKRMRSQSTPLPDLSAAKSQPRPKQIPFLRDEEKYTPYADELEVVSGKKQ
jgi:signal recognition particle GTPase